MSRRHKPSGRCAKSVHDATDRVNAFILLTQRTRKSNHLSRLGFGLGFPSAYSHTVTGSIFVPHARAASCVGKSRSSRNPLIAPPQSSTGTTPSAPGFCARSFAQLAVISTSATFSASSGAAYPGIVSIDPYGSTLGSAATSKNALVVTQCIVAVLPSADVPQLFSSGEYPVTRIHNTFDGRIGRPWNQRSCSSLINESGSGGPTKSASTVLSLKRNFGATLIVFTFVSGVASTALATFASSRGSELEPCFTSCCSI